MPDGPRRRTIRRGEFKGLPVGHEGQGQDIRLPNLSGRIDPRIAEPAQVQPTSSDPTALDPELAKALNLRGLSPEEAEALMRLLSGQP